MFGSDNRSKGSRIDAMIRQARIDCRYDQDAMARKVAHWMAQDRDFDDIRDKEAFARKAYDARTHGRVIEFEEGYYRPQRGPGSAY